MLGGGGLGATYAITYGGYRSKQQHSLLQSVIRNLVDSEDDQERLTQRKKLEGDLVVASERLDDLVQEHRDKLHGTLSTFDAVDKKIRDSREKIKQVRVSLKSCKSLLRCKREDLKRLWLEDVKYKHMLQMLESIEEVRSVPDKLAKFKTTKQYLSATELLKNSVAKLEGELSSVEALKELKQKLVQEKENLHKELIDELHRHLYIKATACTRSRHMKMGSDGQFSVTPMKKSSTLTRLTQNAESAKMESAGPGFREDDVVRDEVGSGVDPEEDSNHYMAVLVEALSILGRVQDALDAIQLRMEKEFLLIIERASIQVTRSHDNEVGNTGRRRGRGYVKENVPKLLTKMLRTCFKRFHDVVEAHGVLLGHFQRVKRIYKAPYTLYEESDVWTVIQRVVQNALEVYLAVDEDTNSYDVMSGFTAFTSPGDVHSLFSRRKATTTRMTKKPLFRFDSSRHAISINSYMREQRDLELAKGAEGVEPVSAHHFEQDQPSITQHLVCKPQNRNITVVFRSVSDFVEEVEEALDYPPDQRCQLHQFLKDYVEQHFLERVRMEYFEKMGNCAKPEAAKATAPDQKTAKITSKSTVLNSVLTVWSLVEELQQLMKDLPMYSAHFLGILCELLVGYKESLQLLFKGLTSVALESAPSGRHGASMGGAVGGTTYEGVLSGKWAQNEDITSRIKSLSNWVGQSLKSRGLGGEEERVQNVYLKESEIVTSNLPEFLSKQDVVLSHEQLRLLAIFHESMDWFSGQLKLVVLELSPSMPSPTVQVTTDGGAISTMPTASFNDDLDLIEKFSSVQLEFQGLAETSVIMLHFEVRCHCCYFLLPALQKTSYVFDDGMVEEDSAIQQLASDLKAIETKMVAVLSHNKYRYLFEGLGHLVASIFISSTHHIKTINSSGVKKMCRNISVLQSCLSKITLVRERQLDRARKYFEMLYLTFDEISEGMLENEPIYSQEDYKRALTLLAFSDVRGEGPPDKEEAAKKLALQIKELDEIFSRDTC